MIGLVLVVSLWAQDDGQTCPTGNLLREWRGDKTGVSEEGYYIIRETAPWEQLWKRHAGTETPKVDFEHEMVVAAFPKDRVEIGWARVTRVRTPGLSKLWVGLCPAVKRVAFHIAVVGRSDLAVEFWFKDASLKNDPGKEPERGGFAVEAKLVHGAESVWVKRLPELSKDEKAEAEKYVTMLSSDEAADREQAMRGLLRLGARARVLIEPSATSADIDLRTRARQLLEQIPTFEARGKTFTREQALYVAREHLALKFADQFSNDPEMRWEDDGVRYTAGPHWEVRLRYL